MNIKNLNMGTLRESWSPMGTSSKKTVNYNSTSIQFYDIISSKLQYMQHHACSRVLFIRRTK